MLLLQLASYFLLLLATTVDFYKGHKVYSPKLEIFYLSGETGTLHLPRKNQEDSVIILIANGKPSQTYISAPKSITIQGGDHVYIVNPKRKGDARKLKQYYLDNPPDKISFILCPLAEYKELQFLSDSHRRRICLRVYTWAITAAIATLLLLWLKPN